MGRLCRSEVPAVKYEHVGLRNGIIIMIVLECLYSSSQCKILVLSSTFEFLFL